MTISILLVDDDKAKIGRVVELMQGCGVDRSSITVAQAANDAKRHLLESHFDLLILDIALPNFPEEQPQRMGGINLLEELVERGNFNLPKHVIGLTAYDELIDEFVEQFRAMYWSLEKYDDSDEGWIQRLKAFVEYLLSVSEQKVLEKYSTDICIIAALPSPELAALRKVDDWNWGAPKALDQNSFYYPGNLEVEGKSYSAVCAAAPRMGMIASALLTQKLINRFRPRVLAMIGICAGYRNETNFGDVILADPSWDWQTGKYEDGIWSIAPDQIDVPTEIAERFRQLNEREEVWINIWSSMPDIRPSNVPKLRVGPMVSGSAVLADQDLMAEIKEQHRKLLAVDMETYGVYSASKDVEAPRPLTFSLKSVCDFGDEEKGNLYQKYAANVSAMALTAFFKGHGLDLLVGNST